MLATVGTGRDREFLLANAARRGSSAAATLVQVNSPAIEPLIVAGEDSQKLQINTTNREGLSDVVSVGDIENFLPVRPCADGSKGAVSR